MKNNYSVKQRQIASPEERGRQLIEATITAISRNGITRTTLSTVTGIAGLSLGLVNFHFKTKDALLVATLAHLVAELRDFETAGFSERATSCGSKYGIRCYAGSGPARLAAAMVDSRLGKTGTTKLLGD